MDVLSDVVGVAKLGVAHSKRVERYPPFHRRFEAAEGTGFMVVLQGSCWLVPSDGNDSEPVHVGTGDVVFLPHSADLGVADDPATPPSPSESGPPDGSPAVMLCGAYLMDRSSAHPLLDELPPILHLPASIGVRRELRHIVDLLAYELQHSDPGADALVPALLDALLLYILRAWFVHDGHRSNPDHGWAAALSDPPIAAALRAIHGDPSRPWTVQTLAGRAGLSRATFARRFHSLVGRPPLGYLTWWRMTLAARLLRTSDLPLSKVAAKVGYGSEFAFAVAFKRAYGETPGRFRMLRSRAAHGPSRRAEQQSGEQDNLDRGDRPGAEDAHVQQGRQVDRGRQGQESDDSPARG